MNKPITIIPRPPRRKPTHRPEELVWTRRHSRVVQSLRISGGFYYPRFDADRQALEELLDHGILVRTGTDSYRVKR